MSARCDRRTFEPVADGLVVTTDWPSLQRALEVDADALLVAKRGIDGIYSSDPNIDADAVRYDRLTYRRAIDQGVRVMDAGAFVLADEQGLTMHVFDVAAAAAMSLICQGEDLGTLVRR